MLRRVATVDELRTAGRRTLSFDGHEIGVFAVDDDFVAWRNECPHQGGPVCQGRIYRRVVQHLDAEQRAFERGFHDRDSHIVCPWHGLEFDIRNGRHPGNPGLALIPVPVRVSEGEVYVEVG